MKHRYASQIFRKICVYSIQSFQSFEASNLTWPEAHQCFLKRVFLCTFLKFDVQIFCGISLDIHGKKLQKNNKNSTR